MKIRLLCAVLSIIFGLTTFSGCIKAVEVDSYTYVLTMGIDKGEQLKYNVTFLSQSPGADKEGSSAGEPKLVSAEGDNVFDAIAYAQAGIPKRFNFSRNNLIVISQEIARAGEISDFFSASWTALRMRTSVNMLIATDNAREFMTGLTSDSENVNIVRLENNLVEFYGMSGMTPIMSVAEYLSAVNGKRYDAVIPLGGIDESISEETASSGNQGEGSGENKSAETESKDDKPNKSDTTEGVKREGGMRSYIAGGALFSGDKMIGTISGEETKFLLLMLGELESAVFNFKRSDKSKYSVSVSSYDKPKITVNATSSPTVDILLSLDVVLTLDTSIEQVRKMRIQGRLTDEIKTKVEEYIENESKRLLETWYNMECDAIGIGRYAAAQFKSTQEWESYNFRSRLKNIKFSVSATIDSEDVYGISYME